MIDESSIVVESPYLSRLDLKTEIQFIEKGQEIVVPSLYIPDGTREVEIILPRATSADKSLWDDDGNEILFELEYTKDGSAWYPAGAFCAVGGIVKELHPLSKQEFEVPQTEALFSCDFDQLRYRLRSKCDSASSQKISPLILFHSDPAPRQITVKKNSVGYISVQKASGSTITSLTTPTLSIGSGSNRSVSALVGNYYVQTQTAVKFGGSGGTAMNAVPGATVSGSPWARLAGYFLKESEGVTADGTVYASFSASTSAYLTGISADNAKGIHASSGIAPTQTTNGSAISANVTSAANELVIGAALTYTAWSSSPTIAVGSGQTQRSTDALGSSTRMTVSTETAASGSESTSFNPSDYVSYPFYGESTITVMIAWSIEEETGGGGTPYTAELTAAAFGMTPAALNRISDYLANLSAPAFNLTPQNASQSTVYTAQLSSADFDLSPENIDARYGFVASMTAAAFGMTAQALTSLYGLVQTMTAAIFSFVAEALNTTTSYSVDLTAADFDMTGQDLDARYGYSAGLSAPTFSMAAEDISYEEFLGYVASLTAAVFGMTAEDLTVLRGYVAELTAPAFNFTARAVNILTGAAEDITGKVVGFLVNIGRFMNR